MAIISLGDLQRRVYVNKDCVQFDYTLRFEQNDLTLNGSGDVVLEFLKSPIDKTSWRVTTVFPATPWSGARYFEFNVDAPNATVATDVVKVCAMGLNALKTALAIEQQDATTVLFGISEILES